MRVVLLRFVDWVYRVPHRRAYTHRSPVLVISATLILFFAGCSSDAVQEDRTIAFGAGGTATFQHGSSGVFINVDGQQESIFTPDDKVVATSSPLWSPDKNRVLFTVARSANPQGGSEQQDWNDTPDGRTFAKQAVQYDCYVCVTAKEAGGELKPQKMFSASVRHVGYIAANLVAKWTPDGDGIVFVSVNKNGQHELKTWDLTSRTEKRVFPHAVDWMVFDFVPDSSQLVVCAESRIRDGIWIGSDETEWWHVSEGRGPQRLQLATSNISALLSSFATSDSPIERLRALEPKWSADGTRFAFVTAEDTDNDKINNRHTVHLGTLADKSLEQLTESESPVLEVRWNPKGQSLGIVHTQHKHLALSSLSLDSREMQPLSDRTVHQFAGWNSSGSELAMVAPMNGRGPREDWALVLARNAPGREALVLSGANGERELFSGTRITFPNWSPDGNEISFWVTFTPSYRSWLNMMGGGGVRDGDPATTINIRTGAIRWMPVDAIEKLQIGHYYLLKGDAPEARRWYDEAQPDLPEQDDSNRERLMAAKLYRSICLDELKRTDEADAAFKAFLTGFEKSAKRMAAETKEDQTQLARTTIATKYLFLLEVYASVDRFKECESRLSQLVANGPNADAERLMQTIALSQLLLLQDRHHEYATLAGDEILPQATKLFGNANVATARPERPVLFATQFALLPLFSEGYLAKLDADTKTKLATKVQTIRDDAKPSTAIALDRLLVRLHTSRSEIDRAQNVMDRLVQNKRASELEDKAIDNCLQFARVFPELWSVLPEEEPAD